MVIEELVCQPLGVWKRGQYDTAGDGQDEAGNKQRRWKEAERDRRERKQKSAVNEVNEKLM